MADEPLSQYVEQFQTDAGLVRQFVRGDETTEVDIDGEAVPSIKKIKADLVVELGSAAVLAEAWQAATEAGEFRAAAKAAQAITELARDASLADPTLYPSEEAGRAAVADNVYFRVVGSGQVACVIWKRINAGASQPIVGLASNEAVEGLRVQLAARGLSIYSGEGPVYPLATDVAGNVVIGFDAEKNTIVGVGILTHDAVTDTAKKDVLGPGGVARYIGGASVIPITTDVNGNILLGFDVEKDKIVGRGLPASATLPCSKYQPEPLAASQRPVSALVNHMLFYGQSLSVGARGIPVLSTTQPYNNITFHGGPRAWDGAALDFLPAKPLVEDAVSPSHDGATNRGETACSGAANYALSLAAVEDGVDPASHVVLASTAGRGGTAIAGLAKASGWYTTNFLPHITNGKAINSSYALHAVCWMQGEQDVYILTDYATYRVALAQLQADIESDAQIIGGQSSPVYCLTYQVSYGAATHKDIAIAQLDLAKEHDKFVLVTPCYHLPFASDQVHLTAVGNKWIGAYFGRAYKQLVIDGLRPAFLKPLSATRRGAEIRVRFDVPQGPMVLDTITLAVTIDAGFKILDGVTPVTISSITIDGDDVVIVLGAEPAGVVTVRYGIDYLGAGLLITGGASGNLRDSTSDAINIDGISRPLYHVCPHFEMTSITLGE